MPGIPERALISAAASAERSSEHPVDRAIVRFAEEQSAPISDPDRFEYRIGRGIAATLKGEQITVGNRSLLAEFGIALPEPSGDLNGTEVHVAVGSRYYGAMLITDQLHPSAISAVKTLHEMKIRVALLTGDTRTVAESLADHLGIIQVYSELLPQEKAQLVAAQVRKGRTVAMLGDGINDAPALSEATVGVATGAGTDVARESADVVLIGNDLEKFVETVRIARNCRRIILENFYRTLIVDTIGIGLAAAGILNPLMAAFIHVTSELSFIVNSTRFLAPKQRRSTATADTAFGRSQGAAAGAV